MKSGFYSVILICALLFIRPIHAQTWQEYNQQMFENFQAGKFEKAVEYGEKAVSMLKDTDPGKADYGSVLNNLAYIYLQQKEYKKAEKAYLEVLEIITPVLGKEHKIYARTISYLGEIYLYTGQFDKAENYLSESTNIRRKLLPETAQDYTNSLVLLKKLAVARKKPSLAISYQDSVLIQVKKNEGENSPSFFSGIIEKASLLNQNGNKTAAVALIDGLFDSPLIKNSNHSGNLELLRDIIYSLRNLSQYKKAISACQALIDKMNAIAAKSIDLAYDYNLLGLLYYEDGQFDRAGKAYQEALDLIKETGRENSALHGLVLHNMAVLNYDYGNYIDAEQYYLKAKEIREKTTGKNHPDYVSTINGLATLYYEWGNTEKAEPLYLEALNIIENIHLQSETYYVILTNLGELYENSGKFTKAADYYLKAYKTGEILFGRKNLEFARLVNKMARFYKNIREYDLADSLYNECIANVAGSVGTKHPYYAFALNSRAVFYLKTKDYLKAEKDLIESAGFNRKFYGDYHLQYAISQNNLASLYYSMNDWKKSEKYVIGANEILINQINSYLAYLTSQESEAYLNSTDYLFDVYYSYYLMEKDKNPALAGIAYDDVLARKGVMLQSEKSLRNAILKTKNHALIKDYEVFIGLKEKLAKYYTVNESANNDSIKILKEKINQVEKKLSASSAVFSQRNQLNATGWMDIKKGLQKGEAAVEFIRFRFYNLSITDSVYYCALIMRPEYKYPKMLFLFEERDLYQLIDKTNFNSDEAFIAGLHHKTGRKEDGEKPKDDQNSNKLDKLIWYPLEEYLKGIETVFYSPAGLLNNISFAALSVNDTTYVSDKYKLHTLLSTRNIIGHQRFMPSGKFKISLYGGIEYDMEPEDFSNVTKTYHKDSLITSESIEIKKLTETIKRGENWNYLHGTLQEIQEIEALLETKNAEINSYKGKMAVEETFKQYNGEMESPSIIHIATHGFFFPDVEDHKTDLSGNENQRSVFRISQNPLVRSGLLFAGANRSWNHKEMPANTEDGILTAYEVSNTNLNNTELVVLSACETGLGEIKGSEGVYGLQRSFKIAGAEYVIMSLWQIPDFQTVELMKSFYSYRNTNLTIPEAFQQAQNEMKRKYLPYYWAAFVLIK